MAAYGATPNSPLPVGAQAIQRVRRGLAPGMQQNFAAPVPDPALNLGTGDPNDVPDSALQPPQPGQPGGVGSMPVQGLSQQAQNAANVLNSAPNTQTAAGGVVRAAAPMPMDAQKWADYFNSRRNPGAGQPTGAARPRVPSIMVPSRTPVST